MAPKQILKSRKKLKEVKDKQLHDRVEVSMPLDFPFGSISCQRKYANVFSQLFQTFRPKDSLK
jgi:hypothetical protein